MVAETSIPPEPPARRLERWAGLGGVAYVVLFVIGAILSYSAGQPDRSAAPEELVSYYGNTDNHGKINLGWLLVVLGVFLFLLFLAGLRQAVARLDGDGFLTTLTTVGGAVYATLALAAISLSAAIKTMSDDTFEDTVYPELIYAADDVAYVFHSAGGIGAGAMMIAASLAALRGRALPSWAGWLGIALGVLALFSIFFFPQLGIAAWIVAAGVLLFLRPDRRPA